MTDVEWPEPQADRKPEPVDLHRGPLDDDEDYKFLERDDSRRQEAERRLSRRGD